MHLEEPEQPERLRLPDRPRPSRRTLTLIVTPLVGLFALSTFGNAIHPRLLTTHPLWLVAMEPRMRYLLLVAGRVEDFLPFLAVAVVRRLLSDPLYYLLGHLYGDAGVRWAEKRFGEGGRFVRMLERAFAKAGYVMVFLIPGPLVCLLAGATGMKVAVFFAVNIVGTIASVTATFYFASLVSGPIDFINRFYGRNSRWLVIVSIVFTLGWLVMQRVQGKGELASVTEIESELEAQADRVEAEGAARGDPVELDPE